MTDAPAPGRSLVSRRALVDVIRPAVLGSYGVTGLVGGSFGQRMLGRLGLVEPGIHVALRDGLAIDLHLTVAYGLPIAEVARQADSAVRYAIRRALAREIDRLTIHVGGTSYQPASAVALAPEQDEPAAGTTGGAESGEAVSASADRADDRS